MRGWDWRKVQDREWAGPPRELFLGNLRALRTDPLAFLLSSARQFGGVVPINIGPRTAYHVSDPEIVREVLHTRVEIFSKSNVHYRRMRPVTGEGLLTTSGEQWRHQRRAVQPVFHPDRVEHLVNVVTDRTEAMLDRWQSLGGRAVSLGHDLARLVIEITGESLFGVDLAAEASEIDRAFSILNRHFGKWSILSLFPLLPTPGNVRCWAALRVIEEAAEVIMRAARARPNSPLSSAFGRTDSPAARKECRDQVVTLLIAGYETTVCALLWTLSLVARHVAVDRRLAAESRDVLANGSVTSGCVEQLAYARSVLQESMRLYPPVWILSRSPVQPQSLGGRVIPAGAPVLISPYVIHRLPRLWPKPHSFNPARFERADTAAHYRYFYLPFGAGSRSCIGSHFAMVQATLILALVTRRFRIDTSSTPWQVPEPLVTLRPTAFQARLRLRARA